MSQDQTPEHQLLRAIIESIQESNNDTKKIIDGWKEHNPYNPIPFSLPDFKRNGASFLTVDGYFHFKQWVKQVYQQNRSMNTNLKYGEWDKYAQKYFLSILNDSIEEKNSLNENRFKDLNKEIKSRMRNSINKNINYRNFIFFPLNFSQEELTTPFSIYPACFIPPKNIKDEIKKLEEKTKEEYSDVNQTIESFNKFSPQATCFFKIAISGYGPEKSAAIARTVASLTSIGLLLPFQSIKGIRDFHIMDEPQTPYSISTFNFRENGVLFPNKKINMPILIKGDIILNTEGHYYFYKQNLSRIITNYFFQNGKKTNLWKSPDLAAKWLTSLHWYYRALRSFQDSEAMVLLSNAINTPFETANLEQIIHGVSTILEFYQEDFIFRGHTNFTLRQIVTKIYSNYRSQLVHGNLYPLIGDFEPEREISELLVLHFLLAFYEKIVEKERSGEDTVEI